MTESSKLKQVFASLDLSLIAAIAILYGLGVMTIYSATYGQGLGYVERQLINGIVAAMAMVVFFFIGIRRFFEWSYLLYGLLVISLIALLFLGDATRGSHRWVYLGGFAFQPSEMGKLILCLALARFLALKKDKSFSNFLKVLGLSAASGLFVLLQPDLGTSIIYVVITISCLWVWGLPKKYFAGIVGSGLACMPIGWPFLRDYQKLRILTFLNPNIDPLGAGYNVIQSRIAVGSGGVFGKGFLKGTQSKLQFLPEPHTDFIFGVFAEEFGFVGAFLVLCLYAFVLWRILLVGLKSKDLRVKIFVGGFTGWILFHVFESVGMSMGLLPVTGLALPFMSYGGSSIISLSCGFGLLLSACLDFPKRYE